MDTADPILQGAAEAIIKDSASKSNLDRLTTISSVLRLLDQALLDDKGVVKCPVPYAPAMAFLGVLMKTKLVNESSDGN